MFRGANKVTVDAKGRLAIPTRYRDRIAQRSDGQLIITVDRQCLLIYPLPDWEEIERKLVRLPSLNPQARRLQQFMVGYASDVALDSHGRVLLAKELREFAAIDRQALLIGQGNKFELWDETRWSQRIAEWLKDDQASGSGLPPELESLSL
ncbi:MAG: division/cell wall cluster transcriptional repressor MraZ [Gammaproteobacteria bacterium]|nr:division/cell wall cluster transcriptional repressor MraZ [Gammaproteobacteria bacterium]